MHELNRTIESCKNAKVAVIGDLCLDMYYFLSDEKTEISVETGLRTRSVSDFAAEAGGAGNVAVNLSTLRAAVVDAYGVIGADPFGHTLKSILTEAGVNCDNVLIQKESWNTHVYHKLYKDGLEEPRCDIGNFNSVKNSTADRLLASLESNIQNYDAVIINEQIKHGYHSRHFQTELCALIKKHENNCLWITDCRHLNDIYDRTIRKLNIHEARALYLELNKDGTEIPDNPELLSRLHSYWKKPLVITLGEDGAIAIGNEGKMYSVNGVNIIGRTDTVGAGDAFLSAFALALAAGSDIENAVQIGNFSASVSVTRIFQTGHPTADEIKAAAAAPDYRYNPEKAADIRAAEYIEATDIELICLDKTPYPKVAIFDHDGTISTLRQGWEPVMKDVCVNAILGKAISTVSAKKLEEINEASAEMIEKTTGIQTIIQMHHLREMVLSFGYVAETEALTPLEYKKIYNDKLLEMVSGRVERFTNGLLDIENLTIKGAVQFLEELKNNGVRIYLASGTDSEDVRNEAQILGYADYFNGGIYGSVGNPAVDPKREVIETIVGKLPKDIQPNNCYVFGDGPVEMREAARRGFTRIGIVSDEKQRYGINYEKRPRLVLGGAQALIPDFSWIPALARYMGWERK
ncbi:MAG: PfkB family carbohydrate kinase [Spirochaetales bacterium]|uniref:PfkB family carbohydrate kinase n=1 Tax=Candidatus Thalassospirochaeta sargassi TaxID=3119039 RepID=A0AAJ1IFK5_9SPIO|nr:PfkB family carbohydrate kinase [Spirochaetales bacterium]